MFVCVISLFVAYKTVNNNALSKRVSIYLWIKLCKKL